MVRCWEGLTSATPWRQSKRKQAVEVGEGFRRLARLRAVPGTPGRSSRSQRGEVPATVDEPREDLGRPTLWKHLGFDNKGNGRLGGV
jgi:hypothetical protein